MTAQLLFTARKHSWFLLYLAIALLYSLSFILNSYPPFQDYPNHLLEGTVIAHPGLFSPWYGIALKPAPNVTSQLALAAGSLIMDVNLAGRLYCILYLFLFSVGAYLFARIILNRNYLAGLLFFLFTTNFYFWRGYLNFILGYALCLIFLTLSHRHSVKAGKSPLALDILFGVTLYFTHALTAGVFILYKLLQVICFEQQKIRYCIKLLTPVLLLSLAYALLSVSQEHEVSYGTGLWKLTSLKRLVAIPYISSLTNARLFSLINWYNLIMYLIFIAAPIFTASHLKAMKILDPHKSAFGLLLAGLALIYCAAPNRIGDIEVDVRFSFFFVMFLFVFASDHLLTLYPKLRTTALLSIPLLIGVNCVISFIQIREAQPYLSDLIRSLQESKLPRNEPIYVPRTITHESLAQHSRLYQVLETIKLHTDVNQVTFIDEHADSYFYMNGGNPPKLFTFSIIRKMP